MVTLVRDHGVDYLFAATILTGIFQIFAGLLKLGSLMRFVSRSVTTGFVNALAILIFLAQMPELIGVGWMTYPMVAGGLAIIYLLPRLTTAVPSPLVCIVVLTAVSIFAGLEPRAANAARDLALDLVGGMPGLVPFGTEAGIWQGLGIDTVLCGPGDIAQAHRPDEYLEESQLAACLDMLEGLAARLGTGRL